MGRPKNISDSANFASVANHVTLAVPMMERDAFDKDSDCDETLKQQEYLICSVSMKDYIPDVLFICKKQYSRSR